MSNTFCEQVTKVLKENKLISPYEAVKGIQIEAPDETKDYYQKPKIPFEFNTFK